MSRVAISMLVNPIDVADPDIPVGGSNSPARISNLDTQSRGHCISDDFISSFYCLSSRFSREKINELLQQPRATNADTSVEQSATIKEKDYEYSLKQVLHYLYTFM